ncbi:MAG: metallophosphatase family protein [Prevotellaceae bacterium]|jgi:putative phosphoesterase|nr:metallophosphatase family protein [Prevotellaceae bacterium]
MKIGIISDTHSFFDDRLRTFLQDVDEIWHAGDVGGVVVADTLAGFKPVRGVYGNIDGAEVRAVYPRFQRFCCEGVEVLMTHIGGYPGRYDHAILDTLYKNPPQLFVCGHSHILKVMYDKKLGFLCVNPGAAGKSGFHHVRTAVRLDIANGNMSNLEVGEWPK